MSLTSRYHMHKQEAELTDPAAIEAVLRAGRFATLALCRDGEPYVVTMNYGFEPAHAGATLYFHCANAGLKLDIIRANPRACGTVVEDRGYQMGKCSHSYRSVVFWGDVAVVEDTEAKRHALEVMIGHLEDDPDGVRRRVLADPRRLAGVTILRLTITGLTGKAGQ